ncbi:MAG: hypothetical protein H7Z41_06945 [Cytophagales bacterium]|nr:hypothetical protein [Armatimonadota bacterium]
MNRSGWMGVCLAGLLALGAVPARAQYTGALGSQHNNMMSATLSTMIQGMSNMAMLRGAMYRSAARRYQRPDPQTLRGKAIIRRGQATMRFTPRPFPLDKWLRIWGNGDAEKRRKAYDEWVAQRAIWESEVRQRGAKRTDMADMMALAFAISYEAYSEKRIGDAGFRYLATGTRKAWMKDPVFQGRSVVSKQEFHEELLLSATYALYLRRHGSKTRDTAQIALGRDNSKAFLDKWWSSKANGFGTQMASLGTNQVPAAGAVSVVAVRSAKPVAKAAVPASPTGATPPAFEQAVRLTSFQPVSESLMPARFAATITDAKQREKAEDLYLRLISGTRSDMERNTSNLPVNNVARAMSFAAATAYDLLKTPEGKSMNDLPSQLTKTHMESLRRQFAVALAGDPGFRKLSDREKQEAYEMYLLMPSMAALTYNAAVEQKDVEGQRSARGVARATLTQLFGAAPEKLHFTETGLVIDLP